VVKDYYPGALVTVEGGKRRVQPAPWPAPCRCGQGVPGDRRGVHQRDAQGGELWGGPEPAGRSRSQGAR
jgi:hypothetical protein